jgi:cation diffusion facilitator CzcD-associated flavoprotein CzcO
MAKRARGSVRPGQRRPIDRRPATSGSASEGTFQRAVGLTDAETKRAAEIEAAMLAEERAADVARKRTQERSSRDISGVGSGAGSLAVRAQQEYAYVGRDVREIARIAAILFTILIVLWILVDVTKVIPIL